MNKYQQVPEDQQYEKSAMEHAKKQYRVHRAQKHIDIFLIPRPHHLHMTH